MTGEREARLAEVLLIHQADSRNRRCWSLDATGPRCEWKSDAMGSAWWQEHATHVAQAIAADERDVAAAALREAADALEAQPPKTKANYVAVLRLYADEPWRLTGAQPLRARADRLTATGDHGEGETG